MNSFSKDHDFVSSPSSSTKLPLRKPLARVWQDLQNEQKWKYEELSPARLLERLNLLEYSRENDEFARANWFWGRRPRVLTIASYLVWLIVIVGLPFWLFILPVIGLPLIVILLMMVNLDIVQSLRWRRQYELSIDRLIGASSANANERKTATITFDVPGAGTGSLQGTLAEGVALTPPIRMLPATKQSPTAGC